jgi:hypothetical protein
VSQKDIYHEVVKSALVKEGWTITHDPFLLRYADHNLYVDLGAEAPIGAEKGGRKIAVEIKSFVGRSEVADLEQALGQYGLYRFLLARVEPDRSLYLAVPEEAYYAIFDSADGRDLVAEQGLKLFVFAPESEVVLRWMT